MKDFTRFFYISNTFVSNARLKLAKDQADAKHHLKVELWLSENYSYSSSTLSSVNNTVYSKNKQKNKRTCIHVIIRLIIMKMEMKKKNRSHKYNLNGSSSWHGHKYGKYKTCLSMIIIICIKQHLSNIWSSIHEKVKQRWSWVEKKRCLLKQACSCSSHYT